MTGRADKDDVSGSVAVEEGPNLDSEHEAHEDE